VVGDAAGWGNENGMEGKYSSNKIMRGETPKKTQKIITKFGTLAARGSGGTKMVTPTSASIGTTA